MSDMLNIQIADIINRFLKENKLVDARTCEGEFLGMHSSLTIGGAHEVVEEIEKIIANQVREARIDTVIKDFVSLNVYPLDCDESVLIEWRDDTLAELKGDDK